MAFTATGVISLVILFTCKESHGAECVVNSRNDRDMSIKVSSARNTTGDWLNTFAARRETERNSSGIDVDISWKFNECEEKEIFMIRGELRESMTGKAQERLTFHPNCGTNVAIVNDGQTIMKLRDSEQYDGVAITSRPLRDNELFEVRLDTKKSQWNYGMVMGVTTHDPKTMSIPKNIDVLKSGTWYIGLENVYMNGIMVKSNYVEHLKNLKVGDRLGVKRTEFGTLHFYINGADQGPAASRVPASVFGVYEVRNDVFQASIVNSN